MALSDIVQSFVAHCGEMGGQWGFNKTVGQLFGLLVVSEEPVHADDIANLLQISRSNVSMALKELQSWRVVKLSHKPGDRKEYFSAAGSIWEMAKIVMEERRKRELDPTLAMLRFSLVQPEEQLGDAYAKAQMQEIYDLLELLSQWSSGLQDLTPEKFRRLMKLGENLNKLLELKDKIVSKASKKK